MSVGPSPVAALLTQPSMIDFPGHLAGVLFVAGCNFRCGFCHNAGLLGKPMPGMPWEQLRQACERFRQNWVDSVVVTGGEPTLADGLPDLLRFLRESGFQTKLDTNGSRPDVLENVLPLVDYVAMDVKGAPSQYAELVGYDDLDRIRASVCLVRERAGAGEFRTTVIEGVHEVAHVAEIGALIQGAHRYVLQPFLPREDLPEARFRRWPRTSMSFLERLREPVAGCVREVVIRGG